jgi:hypothetical protein
VRYDRFREINRDFVKKVQSAVTLAAAINCSSVGTGFPYRPSGFEDEIAGLVSKFPLKAIPSVPALYPVA